MFLYSIWVIFWHSLSLCSSPLSGKSSFSHSLLHIFWHTFWQSMWHIFWHSIWHIFWHPIWHCIWQIFWHSIWQTFWTLSGIPCSILSGISELILAGISSGSWGPAVPTARGSWRRDWRRVGKAEAGSWGPAVPTACGSWRRDWRRVGKAEAGSWGPAVPTARGSWRRDWQRVGKAEAGSWGPAVPTAHGSWRRDWRRVGKAEAGSWGPAVPTAHGNWRRDWRRVGKAEAGSWGPAVPTARGSWRRDWRRVGKAEVDVEADADMAEEKPEGGRGGGGGGEGGGWRRRRRFAQDQMENTPTWPRRLSPLPCQKLHHLWFRSHLLGRVFGGTWRHQPGLLALVSLVLQFCPGSHVYQALSASLRKPRSTPPWLFAFELGTMQYPITILLYFIKKGIVYCNARGRTYSDLDWPFQRVCLCLSLFTLFCTSSHRSIALKTLDGALPLSNRTMKENQRNRTRCIQVQVASYTFWSQPKPTYPDPYKTAMPKSLDSKHLHRDLAPELWADLLNVGTCDGFCFLVWLVVQ